MGVYSQLYKYRETPSFRPLENFLTEALADIFNRLPTPLQIALIVRMLPASCSERLRNTCKEGKKIEARTQVPIVALGSVKRPDVIVYLDGKPLLLFEIKCGAPVGLHGLEVPERDPPMEAEKAILSFQNQLKTYADWIASQCTGDWSGAVVLLTHGTPPPEGFEDEGHGDQSVVCVTRKWKDVGEWLAKNLDLNQSETTYCALASDFNDFLEEKGLMTEFMTSRDLAATALFMPAYRALDHTFQTVISAITSKYPKSRGGNVHRDFDPDGNLYWAWYYLNNRLNPASSKFFIAIGICFPNQGWLDNQKLIPKHEPFFFIFIGDDWEKVKTSKLLSKVPEGWVEIYDGENMVVTRPVSQFEPDPDLRVHSLINWAQKEVGRAMACIPNFEAAPIQKIQEIEAEG
jgi:hypothetical protein